ncbi:MAG: hypothetical protein HYZ53_18435 [Planctomycetes bacterium]|nr:hypothetical protein [Planctomycetota bacterium]
MKLRIRRGANGERALLSLGLCLVALLLPSRSAASEPIGYVYLQRATREESRTASVEATLRALPALRQGPWRYIGPFDNAGGRGVAAVYAPERELDFAASYVGADGREVRWRDGPAFVDGRVHDLDLFGRLQYSLCYLHRTLEADGDRDVTLLLGSDDSLDVWLDGRRLHQFSSPRGMPARKDEVGVKLVRGKHDLLLKVANWEGPTQFYYELVPLGREVLAKLEARLDADFPPAGEARYYRKEPVTGPDGVAFEIGGLGFAADGTLFACTRRGEVWARAGNGAWRRFASGLHEPLGLCPGEAGEVYVVQRPELTRLRDTDGDGAADLYETVSDGWGLSGQYHEFAFGPVRDREGNLWGTLNVAFHDGAVGDAQAAYRGWCFRVSPSGEFTPWSTGLRSPDGIGLSPEGELFVTDNQGDYVGTSPLHHVVRGDFHGHPAGLAWEPTFKRKPFAVPIAELDRRRKRPAVLFPHGPLAHSPTQPLWDTTGGRFGPFAGQMFVGDQTQSTLLRVALEKVGGEWQGACFPFLSGFQSGNHRLAFAPGGSLYVGQTDRGWESVGPRRFGIERVTWTGELPLEMLTMSATAMGFDLAFTKPLDGATAASPGAYAIRRFRYLYHAAYGSPEVDSAPVAVVAARVSGDRRGVALDLGRLEAGFLYELRASGLRAEDGTPLLHELAYYTLNRVQ